jgi:hypothetical protein
VEKEGLGKGQERWGRRDRERGRKGGEGRVGEGAGEVGKEG